MTDDLVSPFARTRSTDGAAVNAVMIGAASFDATSRSMSPIVSR